MEFVFERRNHVLRGLRRKKIRIIAET